MKEQWTIQVKNDGEAHEIKAAQVVLANGLGLSTPYMPDIPNRVAPYPNLHISIKTDIFHQDLYKGVVLHATQYTDSRQWKGLKGIIVGTANTG